MLPLFGRTAVYLLGAPEAPFRRLLCSERHCRHDTTGSNVI